MNLWEQIGYTQSSKYYQKSHHFSNYSTAIVYKDDQSIIFNVKDKGLVVVMGCAHAGAINTMKICKELEEKDLCWGEECI